MKGNHRLSEGKAGQPRSKKTRARQEAAVMGGNDELPGLGSPDGERLLLQMPTNEFYVPQEHEKPPTPFKSLPLSVRKNFFKSLDSLPMILEEHKKKASIYEVGSFDDVPSRGDALGVVPTTYETNAGKMVGPVHRHVLLPIPDLLMKEQHDDMAALNASERSELMTLRGFEIIDMEWHGTLPYSTGGILGFFSSLEQKGLPWRTIQCHGDGVVCVTLPLSQHDVFFACLFFEAGKGGGAGKVFVRNPAKDPAPLPTHTSFMSEREVQSCEKLIKAAEDSKREAETTFKEWLGGSECAWIRRAYFCCGCFRDG